MCPNPPPHREYGAPIRSQKNRPSRIGQAGIILPGVDGPTPSIPSPVASGQDPKAPESTDRGAGKRPYPYLPRVPASCRPLTLPAVPGTLREPPIHPASVRSPARPPSSSARRHRSRSAEVPTPSASCRQPTANQPSASSAAWHSVIAGSGSWDPAPFRNPLLRSPFLGGGGGRSSGASRAGALDGGPARRPLRPAPSGLPSLRPVALQCLLLFLLDTDPEGVAPPSRGGEWEPAGQRPSRQEDAQSGGGEGRLLTARPPSSSGTLRGGGVERRSGGSLGTDAEACARGAAQGRVRPGPGSSHAKVVFCH